MTTRTAVRVWAFGAPWALCACLVACQHNQTKGVAQPLAGSGAPPETRPAWVQDLRSFSETRTFAALTVLGDAVFAGTSDGVVRFDMNKGTFVRFTEEQGLAGNQVFALSGHFGSGLWVSTDGGIARYHDGVWTNVDIKHPQSRSVSAMVAMADGFWAGGPHGLGRYQDGKWKSFLPGAQVTCLVRDLRGDGVWVGTDGEGIYHYTGGKLVPFSKVQGQLLRQVTDMGFSPDGGVFAVGRGEKGHLLTFFDGNYWTTYRPGVEVKLRWVQRVGSNVLLAYDHKVAVVHRIPNTPEADKLAPGPLQLKMIPPTNAPAGYPAPGFYTRPMPSWTPPLPTAVTSDQNRVLVATRSHGAVMFDGKSTSWYRTKDLVGEGQWLKMGCTEQECFLAGGRGQGYRYKDGSFTSVTADPEPSARVEAFAKDPGGQIVAVLALADGETLAFNHLSGKKFVRSFEKKITVPEGKVRVRFVRFSPDRKFWLGLEYVERGGESRPWGVAVVSKDDPVVYHRDTLLPIEDRVPGSLALPDDIRDVAFINGTVWLSTSSGVCRVQNDQVDLFTENEALASELTYGVAPGPGKEVWAATYGGVGRYDGTYWRFDLGKALSRAARALRRQGDVYWVGTEKGLVRKKGEQVDRLSREHGLAGDVVYDIFLEKERRIWVLTDQGLSIVSL